MTTTVFHPAMVQLLRLQGRGRRRRMWSRFRQPRRLALSAVACVLAFAWLGNAAMTVWLRETASPPTLRALLSLGLVLYGSWHFAKAAFFRPENPLDWSPAQRELLAAMPLRSRDLVAYQLASITVTTVLKSGLFTILLLPDLRCVPLGLVGLLLVMMTLELLRMAIDIATWGMGQAAYFAYRATVVLGLAAGGLALAADVVRQNEFRGRLNVGEGLRQRTLDILVESNDSVLGYAAIPFQPFIDLILAERITAGNLGLAAVTLATVTALAAAVVTLYTATTRGLARREKRYYRARGAACDLVSGSIEETPKSAPDSECRLRLSHIPRCRGAGALAWRQLLGARRHWGSLLTAMIAPAVLACFPGFGVANPHIAFQTTAGTLAFYTFLLLPTALRFDFHRDLDRLATLKGLPITPAAAAIGQTLAPVLIATVFQALVLAFVISVRSLPAYYLLMGMVVLIPLNVLVFGLDNLIYLLYPYRMQQEGLEIFLRTMLTFTAKGLLFVVGLVAMSTWGFAAAASAHGISNRIGTAINAYAVFLVGMTAGMSFLAALVLHGLCRTYRNMNPIEDIPR
jgi:hypothetical protein